MTETTTSVFGNESTNTPQKIPDEVLAGLISIKTEFGLDRETLMNEYVEMINRPNVQTQNEAKWVVALRGIRAVHNGSYAKSSGNSITLMPFSVNGKAQADAKNGGFKIRVFGLVKSNDAEFEYSGPTSLVYSGFPSEAHAQTWAAGIQTGLVYKTRGKLSNQSATGHLANGQVGFMFADGGAPIEVDTSSDPYWQTATERLMGLFPSANLSEILTVPKPNVIYHIRGEIVRGRIGVDKENRQNGSITLSDDTVSGEIAKTFGGGLFLFLPRDHVATAGLPIGSSVEALIEGYFRADKNGDGQATGNGRWVFNVHTIRTVVDLTPSTAIPNAANAAVTIPEKTVPKLSL
jgi:hypothetical protein